MTGQDIRLALRTLARRPGFTVVAVLTLALGIGANTAIFSVVHSLILRPYTFPELDRLVLVREGLATDASFAGRLAPADALDLSGEARVFDRSSVYRYRELNLASQGEVRPVLGCEVAAGFFDVLGARPARGRALLPDEDQPGRDAVVVLSDGFWRRRGADPGILGQTLLLDGRRHAVVGVMPRGFDYPAAAELWIPLALAPSEATDRTRKSLYLLGRLASGASPAQARAALLSAGQRLEREHRETRPGRTITLVRLREELYQYTVPLFALLQAAAGFLLFLAGANLTNLLFARLVDRQREIAIRTALGSDRFGLLRLQLAESVALSVLGGGLATAASFWTVDLIRNSISTEYTKWVPGWDRIQVDGAAVGATLALACGLGIVFGVLSTLHASDVDLVSALKQGGASTSGGSRSRRVRSALVVGQVALAIVLLVGAGLMVNGFRRIARLYEGLDPAGVLTLEVALPEGRYPDSRRVVAFQDELLRRVSAIAGVRSAGLLTNLPVSSVQNPTVRFTIEGRPTLAAAETLTADLQIASGDVFRTLAIPVVEGRAFNEGDGLESTPVVVVSRKMAERFWPGTGPVGRRLKLGPAEADAPWATVVGTVADVKQNWWDPEPRPTLYLPYRQSPRRTMDLAVRTPGDPLAPLAGIRAAFQAIDAEVAIRSVQPLDGVIGDSLAIVRLMGILMTVFGGVALALAAVGVYGVMAHAVSRRTQEFGTRMALGASPGDVRGLVVGEAFRLCGMGLALGVPAALALARVMAGAVFGVVSVEWPVLTGFTAVLLAAGLLAGLVPAWRATRVDPITALRCE